MFDSVVEIEVLFISTFTTMSNQIMKDTIICSHGRGFFLSKALTLWSLKQFLHFLE